MRVLLPLRKTPTCKHSSTDNLPSLETAETTSVGSIPCAAPAGSGGGSQSTCTCTCTGCEGEGDVDITAASNRAPSSTVQDLHFPTGQLNNFLLNPSHPPPTVSEVQLSTTTAGEQQQQQQQHPDGLEPDRTRLGVVSPRKRPRSSDDSQKKPPAKPSVNTSSSSMGLFGSGDRNVSQNSKDGNADGRGRLAHALVTRNADECEDARMQRDPESPDVSTSSSISSSPTNTAAAYSTGEDSHDFFVLELKKRGLEIREQEGDGNCLFRAVSLQVYGDPSMHGQVRRQCLDFMERDKEHFSQFVPGEDFSTYIQRKRQDGVHGNNPEIQAISELFNRPIEVLSPQKGATPLNIFHAEYKTDDAPIRLSYHDGNHYNAVVDPLVPTAGLGLGLPGLQPGLADKQQMAKAVLESDATADQMELQRALKESQDDELQRAIKESKLSTEHMRSHEAMALSDVDATYFELEQAALEHSLESNLHFEHEKKQRASSCATNHKSGEKNAIESPAFASRALAPSPAPLCAVASLPTSSANVSNEARFPDVACASTAPSVASVAAAPKCDDVPAPIRAVDEYPPVVQEMVMNGFDIVKVVRAVELIGDNFDDVLAFLMSTNSSTR